MASSQRSSVPLPTIKTDDLTRITDDGYKPLVVPVGQARAIVFSVLTAIKQFRDERRMTNMISNGMNVHRQVLKHDPTRKTLTVFVEKITR
jgi:hypothetical protein